MTDLTLSGNNEGLTMSSRLIAETVQSRHSDVCRTVERLMAKDVIKGYAPTAYTHEQNGQQYSEYLIGKRDSYVIVAQLSPEFTARLVDRWQELEASQAPALPQTLPEALRMAADMAERNAKLEVVASERAETIENLKNLFVEGMTPAQFVKGLNGVNCMAINQLLADRNWLFREGSHWRVGSYARDKYLTEQQAQITPRNAEPFVQFKPILLRKGAAAIYKLYLKRELVMKSTWNGEFTHDSIQKVA